jgi:hypothetical protein
MMRYKVCGQSLPELAIILGLIVILAIPAMFLLGGNLQDILANILGGGNQGAVAVAAPSVRDRNPSDAEQRLAPKSSKPQPGEAFYNPKSRNFTFAMSDINGGGTQTASVEGVVQILSEQLVALAQKGETADGEPIPSGLQAMIMDLANAGFKLADAQSSIVGGNGKNDTQPSAMEFAARYDALMAAISEAGMDSSCLRQQIDEHAGIISHVNYHNFEIKNDGVASQVLVGTPIEVSVSRDDSPTITKQSSGALQETASSGVNGGADGSESSSDPDMASTTR